MHGSGRRRSHISAYRPFATSRVRFAKLRLPLTPLRDFSSKSPKQQACSKNARRRLVSDFDRRLQRGRGAVGTMHACAFEARNMTKELNAWTADGTEDCSPVPPTQGALHVRLQRAEAEVRRLNRCVELKDGQLCELRKALGCVHIYDRTKRAGKRCKHEIALSELVISSGDAAKMLDAIKESFDQVAGAV